MAAPDRIFSRPLVAFLLGVAAVLAWGAWQKLSPPSLEQALVRLHDGDLEGAERQRLWRQVLAAAQAGNPVGRLGELAGAMAAVSLGDEPAFRALWQGLGTGPVPVVADDQGLFGQVGLGDDCLGLLLQGWLAEGRGDRAAAARAYGQVAAGALAWELPLAGKLAREGLLRLG